jgi:hypothetical protein
LNIGGNGGWTAAIRTQHQAAFGLSPGTGSYNIGQMKLTSLFLAPADAHAAPDTAVLVALLQELDIVADPLGPSTYLAGDGFARHVVFAGCSPHLAMQPVAEGDPAFCHVAVHGPYPAPRLVTGPNTVKPRCPQCRGRFADWHQQLAAWTAGDPARCRACGYTVPAAGLDWRQHAIAARVLLEMRNVFPGEASPSDRLMQQLEQRFDQPWRYAWAGMLLSD